MFIWTISDAIGLAAGTLVMIREKLRVEGIDRAPIGVQIVVKQPFSDGAKVHNEVPGITVILAGAGC